MRIFRIESFNAAVSVGMFWTCVVLAVVFSLGFAAGKHFCG
jgi:hypothetical protein